jgi:transcription elongation factor Elf1
VPGSLLAGLILAAVRVSQRESVRSAEGACPFCGTRQRLGLAGRKYRLPRRLHCASCGQELELDPTE